MKRFDFLPDVRAVVRKLIHDLAELLSDGPSHCADGYKGQHDDNERGDKTPEMHALQQFGDGNEDNAGEIERADNGNGDDHSEEARKILVCGVLGHCCRLFSREDVRTESVPTFETKNLTAFGSATSV